MKLDKKNQKKLDAINERKRIIAKYISIYLKDNLEARDNLDPHICAYQVELVFGEKILRDIDGFIEFGTRVYGDGERMFSDSDIQCVLAHDVGAALRYDTKVLPKVHGYGQYTKNKVFKSIRARKYKNDKEVFEEENVKRIEKKQLKGYE
tara:strand:- start:7037 stop:7486 length:450 start_codon:yes stop_codon:yes gene_type:complete